MLNLDTHVLLYAVTGALRPREARLLSADRWSVSAIVLWEIAKLAQLGRIAVDLDDVDVIRVLARVHVWPLTREIARTSTRLDIRGDPADELIAATSVVQNIALVTRDRALLKSKMVPHPRYRRNRRRILVASGRSSDKGCAPRSRRLCDGAKSTVDSARSDC
jgi:PIN domain nuclease of toxin-antitoxin system